MPTAAQDRVRKVPLAALLILLSLVLGSANAAAAGSDLREAASRLGSTRQGAAAALLPPTTRNLLDDDEAGAGAGPWVLPSTPGIVSERLPARPAAEAVPQSRSEIPAPARAAYRARAPPAS